METAPWIGYQLTVPAQDRLECELAFILDARRAFEDDAIATFAMSDNE